MSTTTTQRPPKLGERQRWMLTAMAERGGFWYPGCGWVWENLSGTQRVAQSLLRKGYVVHSTVGHGARAYARYDLTDAGRNLAQALRQPA